MFTPKEDIDYEKGFDLGNSMKKSVEKLAHFQCESCNKWFSIGDAPEYREDWYCPWCGKKGHVRK